MTANQDIHAFAVKWFDMFRNTKTVNDEVENSTFADKSFSLGFETDCGKAFEVAYPKSKALNDYRELEKDTIALIMLRFLTLPFFQKIA